MIFYGDLLFTVDTITIVFTGISISLAAFYYISVLRNTQRTQELMLESRQTQLFMQIFQELNSVETMTTLAELFNMEWEDYEDFERRYGSYANPENFGKRSHAFYSLSIIGHLVEDGVISIERADASVGIIVTMLWAKWGDLIKEIRVRSGLPRYFEDFEYLYDSLDKLYREKPELDQISESFEYYAKVMSLRESAKEPKRLGVRS